MSAKLDLGFDAANLNGAAVVDQLDARINEILLDVEKSEVWAKVMSEGTDARLIAAIMREIHLEIFMYQSDAIEAAVAAIGQFPRTLPVALFDEMLHHQVEEFDHGEMALRDYVALGGDEKAARNRKQSPSAFAVAAIWKNIAHKRDPFVYLGAVYLFDALTPIITDRVQNQLKKRFGGSKGLEFIVHHATADVEHARQIAQLIRDVVALYPQSAESILYGFEYFAHIYPLPCWTAAMRRAERGSQPMAVAAE